MKLMQTAFAGMAGALFAIAAQAAPNASPTINSINERMVKVSLPRKERRIAGFAAAAPRGQPALRTRAGR